MQIIDQYHVIEHITPDILLHIEKAGRNCYKSENKIGCLVKNIEEQFKCNDAHMNLGKCLQSSCKDHSSNKFVKMIINNGHHAMLEFGDITVRFITNRGVTHELVRHRLFSFAQESTRYVKYDWGMEFIRPVWCSEDILGEFTTGIIEAVYTDKRLGRDLPTIRFLKAIAMAEVDYHMLIADGWRAEQAREVLPNSLKTEIVVKGNIREWRHMLSLRCSKKAHPQMRALMLPLLAELKKKVPVVFDDLYPGELPGRKG